MKIAILTHPLGTNYGGMLQNYALQHVLKEMGHDPITLHYSFGVSWKIKVLSFFSHLFKRMKGENVPLRVWTTQKEYTEITRHTEAFIKKNISTTTHFVFDDLKSQIGCDKEAVIVGSDQVWRGKNPDVTRFYLSDFQELNIKKIAYAASFGVDYWECTPEETLQCARLAQMFDAISVRERSGVELCKNYLHVVAEPVLDPTLLLTKEDYNRLLISKPTGEQEKYLLSYVLDQDSTKQAILKKATEVLQLSEKSVMVEKKFNEVGRKGLEQCVFAPVENWIEGFKDAEYVVTDSFHGTVFSIIYHKPFISIVNKGRGADRFVSLLSLLHLEDRLVENTNDAVKVINNPIDYQMVDVILESERKKSKEFLKINLK